jgi:hypothetical protein
MHRSETTLPEAAEEIKWVKPGVFILSKNRVKLMLVIRPVFVPLRLVVRGPCV